MQILSYQTEKLAAFLKQLSRQYQVTLHVAGLLEYAGSEGHPLSFLSEYIVHQNPYCMYVKSNPALWNRCIRSKQCVMERLEISQGGIMGVCHCGVAEYLVPVRCRGDTVGFFSAGYYRPEDAVLRKRLRSTARRYGFSEEALSRIYRENIPLRDEPPEELKAAAGMLSLLFSALVEDRGLWPPEFLQSQHGRQWQMMQKALEYLQIHYREEITVGELAAFCKCSRSTLQHRFRELNGVSISAYLKNLRMKNARRLLRGTNRSVGKIAEDVGYRDANYFTLVFSQTHGLSPSEYRKRES